MEPKFKSTNNIRAIYEFTVNGSVDTTKTTIIFNRKFSLSPVLQTVRILCNKAYVTCLPCKHFYSNIW